MNAILTSRGETPERVQASEVKESWGRIRDKARSAGAVVITTRKAETLVLLSIDEYRRLRHVPSESLEALENAFDERIARMQTPKAKAAAHSVFSARPEEFGRAATESVRERENGKRKKKRTR